jgi:CheY-like chemotaxis protein
MAISPLADKKQLKLTRKIDRDRQHHLRSSPGRAGAAQPLSNAVKFTDEGRSRSVRGAWNRVVIGVRDTGIGISRETWAVVQAVPAARQRAVRVYDGPGSAFDLQTHHRVAGREISVKSQGAGTRSPFHCPSGQGGRSEAARARHRGQRPEPLPGHVPARKHGLEVSRSGRAQRHQAATEVKPDLILLDIQLPVIDGYAVARASGQP